MNFEDVKLFYVVACVVLGFVILSPVLMAVVDFPAGERFSELWLLGPGRLAEDYPFDVSAGSEHSVFLGVGNHMGGLQYYVVYVKVRNQTEPFVNTTAGLPSVLLPVYEYRVFLRNNETWQQEVSFSFADVTFDGSVSRVSGVSVDGHFVAVDKVAEWDDENNGFFIQLFFELWIYDLEVSDLRFHNRSVGLMLNMTRSS